MAYFVYIIHSEIDNTYYKGFTEKPEQRIMQHNNGETRYTLTKTP
ncbi:MAG: GIY-YIG nuclease family protein [Candidatus Saccharimonadaceae bacterium]